MVYRALLALWVSRHSSNLKDSRVCIPRAVGRLSQQKSTLMIFKNILHVIVVNFLVYIEFDIEQMFLDEIFFLNDPW